MIGSRSTRGVGAAILALGLAAGLAACTGGERPATTDPGSDEPGVFAPATFDDLLGEWKPLPPANQNAFIHFTEHGLHFGSDGCNSRSGSWGFDGQGRFSAEDGGGTEIGCDNVEISFIVSQAERVEISGDTLRFTSPEGETFDLLRTERQPASIIGSWAGPGSDTAVTAITFDENGEWRGSGGCQEYHGTWSVETTGWRTATDERGQVKTSYGPTFLSIGPAPVEHVPECVDPDLPVFPFAYDTEYSFSMGQNSFAVMSVSEVIIEPPAQPLSFVRLAVEPGSATPGAVAPEAETTDGPARPATFEDLLGGWKAPPPANQNAFVHFTEHGLYFGSDGCNRMSSSWSIDEAGNFEVGGGIMTQIGCNNLNIPLGAQRLKITGNTLLLTDAEGEPFELQRTEKQPTSLAGSWAGRAPTRPSL